MIVFRAYEIDYGVSEDFAFIKWSSWSSYLSLEDLSEHPCVVFLLSSILFLLVLLGMGSLLFLKPTIIIVV